jgi:hypothetical protein
MAMHRPNFDSEAKDRVVYIALIRESDSYIHCFPFQFIYLLCHHTYTFIGWETTTAILPITAVNCA